MNNRTSYCNVNPRNTGYYMEQPPYWNGYPPPQYIQVNEPYIAESAQQGGYNYQGNYPPYLSYQPFPPQAGGGFPAPGMPMQPTNRPPVKKSFNPFANPLQPLNPQQPQQGNTANPYPQQQFMQKSQPSGISSVMNQFKTQDGSLDVNKMMSTAGQMMNTVNQVSSMVKGMGSIFTFVK